MKLDVSALANAAAAITAAIYLICGASVALFPEFMLALGQSWFHGIAITPLSGWQRTPGEFILGLISATGLTWAVGYFFAGLYNRLARS